MIIYPQEKTDGLEGLILSKGSVSFDCPVKPGNHLAKASQKTESQDLFGISSILVSVGWNKNDDVFDKYETWRARSTPINKKFNYMHNEKDIIGHMTKSFVLDIDGNIIPDDTPEEEIPDFFEIGVNSVMYTIWEDPELQERSSTLIKEIADNKWLVSMEVYFPSFNYALSKGSEQKIIERNSDTAFLTKYLKVYNGLGEYQGWKIGRQLKNMFFSGKGLVNNPANDRSLITSFNFNGAIASTSIFNEVKMSDNKDYEKSVAELAVAKKELESATKEKDLLKDQVTSLKGDLESSKAFVKDLQEKVLKLQEEEKAKEQKLAEVNKALAEMIAKAKNSERVSLLVNEGVDKTKAEEIVNKFTKASDEMFAEVIGFHKKPDIDDVNKNIDKSQASENGNDPVNLTETDEADKLLEISMAYIRNSLKKEDK